MCKVFFFFFFNPMILICCIGCNKYNNKILQFNLLYGINEMIKINNKKILKDEILLFKRRVFIRFNLKIFYEIVCSSHLFLNSYHYRVHWWTKGSNRNFLKLLCSTLKHTLFSLFALLKRTITHSLLRLAQSLPINKLLLIPL